MDKHFRYEFTIPDRLNGRLLKSMLQSEFKFSTRLLRSLIPHQGVLKNGEPAYFNQPVHTGDKIFIMLPNESSELEPEPMNVEIRYEDNEVIVANKSPGVLTHPTARERTGSLLAGIAYHLQETNAVPHCVHRLDRDTSGVVMFAKHAHIHHLFDIALRQGNMHRSYCALVWHKDAFTRPEIGKWETIDLPIAQDPNRPSRRVISGSGQRAVTHYRVVGVAGDVSAVEIQLETGRTHQIRLHFSSVGMPLVGDPAYGKVPRSKADSNPTAAATFPRQALHAVHLRWEHPVTKEKRTVTAPVARDIKALWTELSGDASIWSQIEQSKG